MVENRPTIEAPCRDHEKRLKRIVTGRRRLEGSTCHLVPVRSSLLTRRTTRDTREATAPGKVVLRNQRSRDRKKSLLSQEYRREESNVVTLQGDTDKCKASYRFYYRRSLDAPCTFSRVTHAAAVKSGRPRTQTIADYRTIVKPRWSPPINLACAPARTAQRLVSDVSSRRADPATTRTGINVSLEAVCR